MDAEEPNASVTLDLEMPDEEISITLLQNEEHWETLSSEEAVQSAAQEAARVQRSLRESLLQRHGLELSGHLLNDAGPLSPQLLAAMRIMVLQGDELRQLSANELDNNDPTSSPLTEASEARMHDALRSHYLRNGDAKCYAPS